MAVAGLSLHLHAPGGASRSPAPPAVREDWPVGLVSQLTRPVLTYCVVRCELEEVGGQDGRGEEPQENEAAHRRVPHVQVIWSGDTERASSAGFPAGGRGGPGTGAGTQRLLLLRGSPLLDPLSLLLSLSLSLPLSA